VREAVLSLPIVPVGCAILALAEPSPPRAARTGPTACYWQTWAQDGVSSSGVRLAEGWLDVEAVQVASHQTAESDEAVGFGFTAAGRTPQLRQAY
jgi:hypothetical protein